MKTLITIITLFMSLSIAANSANGINSTRKNLKFVETEKSVVDTVRIDNVMDFCAEIVTMRGYAKRAGATKETFLLTNNTHLHISQVEILFQYSDIENVQFHERTEVILCDLPPYSTRQIAIKSFDKSKKFYYKNDKPLKDGIPYEVEIKLLSYSIKVIPK